MNNIPIEDRPSNGHLNDEFEEEAELEDSELYGESVSLERSYEHHFLIELRDNMSAENWKYHEWRSTYNEKSNYTLT